MKIKNDYVIIKNGKTYEFKNTITNEYLELFSKSQYLSEYKLKNKDKKLNYVYIKTDEDIENKDINYKSYYNLINVQDHNTSFRKNSIVSNNDPYIKVDENDWIIFEDIPYEGSYINYRNEIDINTNLIKDGDTIDILCEIELESSVSPNVSIQGSGEICTLNIGPISLKIYHINGNTSYIEDIGGSYKPTVKNKYLLCFPGIKMDSSNINQYTKNIYRNIASNEEYIKKRQKIRLSFIKSNSSSKKFKELNYNEYQYNKFINFNDKLAPLYNYRLPLVNSYYNSSNNRIDTYYTYNNIAGYSKSDGTTFINIVSINDIANKKITKLAFGNESQIYAYIDINNSNIIMQEDEELYIYRKDIMSSDATFNGDGLIPVHLSPLGFEEDNKVYYAELYSVGLGYNPYTMNEEYTSRDNIKVIEEDNTTYSFVLKREVAVNNYPGNNMFSSDTKYPTLFKIANNSYPGNNIYCGDNLFPTVGDYKYFIMKYRLFYFSESGDKVTANRYYTMAFYSNKYGILTIKDKIQRM